MDTTPVFLINGQRPPTRRLLNQIRKAAEQIVDGQRNANAQVVIQKINRRVEKYDRLVWDRLTIAEFVWLRQRVEQMVVDLTFWDDRTQREVSRRFYFGLLTYDPDNYQDQGGRVLRPTIYRNVSVNLIDMNLDR